MSTNTADPQTIVCPTWCVKDHEEERNTFLSENPLHSGERVDIWPMEENSAYGEIDLLTQRNGEVVEGEGLLLSINTQEMFTAKECRELAVYLVMMAERMESLA
ncbi:MAG: hypothetical protein WA994_11990 [Ornithinimicrobium sp.]